MLYGAKDGARTRDNQKYIWVFKLYPKELSRRPFPQNCN